MEEKTKKEWVENKGTWTWLRTISNTSSSSGFTRVNRNLGKANQPNISDSHAFHVLDFMRWTSFFGVTDCHL